MYARIIKVALPQIRCQQHDHAKQYDNDEACHNKRNGGKLHGNISRNGDGNAIIGRYGGCFEEGPTDGQNFFEYVLEFIREYMVGVWYRRKLHGTREASKWWKGDSAYNPWTQH